MPIWTIKNISRFLKLFCTINMSYLHFIILYNVCTKNEHYIFGIWTLWTKFIIPLNWNLDAKFSKKIGNNIAKWILKFCITHFVDHMLKNGAKEKYIFIYFLHIINPESSQQNKWSQNEDRKWIANRLAEIVCIFSYSIWIMSRKKQKICKNSSYKWFELFFIIIMSVFSRIFKCCKFNKWWHHV